MLILTVTGIERLYGQVFPFLKALCGVQILVFNLKKAGKDLEHKNGTGTIFDTVVKVNRNTFCTQEYCHLPDIPDRGIFNE